MKKLLAMVLATAMILSLAGCGSPAPADKSTQPSGAAAPQSKAADTDAAGTQEAAPEIVFKFGSVNVEGMPDNVYADRVAEEIKEKSNGRIVMEVYYNSALGNNTEVLEALQLGTVEMACSSVAFLGGFTKSTHLFDLPYLFKTQEAAYEVCDGEVGQSILADLQNIGLHGMCWATMGWRNLTSNEEIRSPQQMKGRKIRTMDNEMHMACWEAMGASAIPMAFTELYTALQNGTIDDEENSWGSFVSAKLYEVQKYIINTRHIFDAAAVVASDTWWQTLSAEDQQLITAAFLDNLDWQREFTEQWSADYEAEVQTYGNIVIELTGDEWQAFRDATIPVYDKYKESIGQDLIDKVDAVNAKY